MIRFIALFLIVFITSAHAQMKSVGFGYEAECRESAGILEVPIERPITIRGIQMRIGAVILTPPRYLGYFGAKAENTHFEVLYWAQLISDPEPSDFGVSKLIGPGTHGGCCAQNYLMAGIVKSWITIPTAAGQLNAGDTVMGLSIAAKPGQSLKIAMVCDGFLPGSMEIQGVLYYDPQ
jgi:hypothetical protein